MACNDCHGDAVQGTSAVTGQHGVDGDGNLDVYDSAAGDLGYTANVASTAPLYATQTCNTSYCHGDNMPKGTTSGTTNAPTWGTTNGDGCTFCHDMAPAAIGAHSGKGLTDCIDCHGAGSGSINAAGTGFTNGGATHMNGIVEGGGDSCTDCHSGALGGVHTSHTDRAGFLGIKTVSGGDYGTNGWYTTTWTNGQPMFGCGECHPAGEGTSHPTAGLNIDLDPAGETPPGTSPKSKNTDTPTNPDMFTGSSVTCKNIYCHSDATASPAYATTEDWYGGSISGNCTDCHGNSPSTNAHALHAVGIHYDTLFDDDGTGLMATDPTGTGASGGADAAHGNSATSDTIGCQTCHPDTVAVEYNSANSICTTCHAGATGSPLIGDEKVIINTGGSTHVNTQSDVSIASLVGFKSKAQVRNDISTVTELDNSWERNDGGTPDNTAYKLGTGASYDAGKTAAPVWNIGGKTCATVDCHNGNMATWTDSNVSCMYCHTSLPQ
jgi:predicted CxxxxCH...CXXCH cytochrome family protein